MKIFSLNAWGGKLHAPLLTYLQQVDPDILCLQEVVHTPHAQKEWLTYRDGDHVLPQRAQLFRELCEALPEHAGFFSPNAEGVLFDGETALPSQFGLATFVRQEIPIIAQAVGFVHGGFSPKGYGEHPRPRNAHVLRVFDRAQDRTLTIAHMHGLRDLRGKMDTPQRQQQARRFADLIGSVAEPADVLVACGDFNVEPRSATFDILGELGMTDLVTTRGFQSTRTSHYTKPGRFADYMLVNEAGLHCEFEVVSDPEVSDHCPLLLCI
ncbi:endonuclease/exonuclease/phosphatase family protein [Rhizobium sp. FY34]|uniref:endonuclease/exonuclease/phosphatase family protein n=1 Tax=Rhizobium sp. FY34 TaxID=2562309 RepID=UPI0010BF6831|nr:endonuclease/exonuclease/phosphatase family protein [Rhizobium sp. FY34]